MGSPCGAPPIHGSSRCFMHDPRQAEKRARARRAGGTNRRTPRARSIPEATSVRTISEIRTHLEAALADTFLQENSAQRSRTIGYLLGLAVKILEVGDFEERIEALEALNEYSPATRTA